MIWVWVAIAIVALLADIITSTLLFVWFTVGGLGAILASLLGFSITIQIIVFLLVSSILIIGIYPVLKKKLKINIKTLPTTEQKYIGREITIDEDVVEEGRTKIDGIYWTVKNEGEPLTKGDKVMVTGIHGNKILVKKF